MAKQSTLHHSYKQCRAFVGFEKWGEKEVKTFDRENLQLLFRSFQDRQGAYFCPGESDLKKQLESVSVAALAAALAAPGRATKIRIGSAKFRCSAQDR